MSEARQRLREESLLLLARIDEEEVLGHVGVNELTERAAELSNLNEIDISLDVESNRK